MSDMTRARAVEILEYAATHKPDGMTDPADNEAVSALAMGAKALRQMEEIDNIVHHCDNYEDVAYNVLYVVDSNQYK